jgi:hypothetical protein
LIIYDYGVGKEKGLEKTQIWKSTFASSFLWSYINPFRIVKVEDHTKDPPHTKFECFVIGIYFVVFQPS